MRTRSTMLAAVLGVAGCLVAQAQTPVITNLLNTGTGNPGPIAPGEQVNISGSNLGDPTTFTCGGGSSPVPTVCGAVSVLVNGKAALVRSEQAQQVAFFVPIDLTGTGATIQVTRQAGGQTVQSNTFNATVAPTAPGLFTSGLNTGAAPPVCFCTDSSGKQITYMIPAQPGSMVTILGTGFGVTNPVFVAGTPVPATPAYNVVAAVKITVGGQNAVVSSATLSVGGLGAADQVTFQVPTTALTGGSQFGGYPVMANVGGVNSQVLQLPVAPTGPQVNTVVNSASNAVPGLPNAGVAPGSIVVAYGKNLGPATLTLASGYPWPDTLSGTSAQITVNGTSTKLLLYYTSANQIAGLLPSSTPTGNGNITVTYNGQAGSASSINVQPNNFGVFTVSQDGTGPGIVTFADYSLVSQTQAANPGETLIIWGTGLGAVTGNEAAGPLPGDMTNLPVQVYVGGVAATVVYRGRSGCCVGEDQIAFVVPNVTGCNVPLAVQVRNNISNYSLMAVASSGRACVPAFSFIPDAFSAIPQPKALVAQLKRQVNPPPQFPGDQPSSDDIQVSPFKLGISGAQLNVANDGLSAGSCFVYFGNQPNHGDPPIIGLLDAGPSLTLKGPNGTTRTIAKSGLEFSGHLGDTSPGNFLDPGAYTISGSGGADIGSFTGAFSIAAFTWTNKPANNNNLNINRSQGVTAAWTGGDANGFVTISGGTGGNGPSASFLCYARGDAGTFTVPPTVLLALPAGGGSLSVQSNPAIQTFTVPGTDLAGVGFKVSISSLAQYQ